MPWINRPVPTVEVVGRDGNKLIINKSDFNEKEHKLFQDDSPVEKPKDTTPETPPEDKKVKLRVKRKKDE